MLRLRRYPAHKPTLLLQAAEEKWTYDGDLSLNHDLDIYSELTLLPTKIEATSHNLNIYTHSLFTSTEATIGVSGSSAAAIPNTLSDSPSDGSSGNNAGSIRLYVELADPKTLETVSIAAAGGHGSDGQSSGKAESGGRGGNGGNSGSVLLALNTGRFSKELVDKTNTILDGDYESKEDQSQALLGFCEYFDLFASHAVSMPSVAAAVKELRASLSAGADAKDLLIYLRKRIISELENSSLHMETSIRSKINVRPGDAGAGGRGTTSRGAGGTPGMETPGNTKVMVFNPDADEMRKLPLAIAHPDQCAMVLQSAKIDYYRGDKESVESCGERLVRLRDRLLFLEGLSPSDPIYQAYKDAEPSMHLVPRADLPKEELHSIASLREIYGDVISLLNQLTAGYDFFGHKPDWVPRGSRTFYDELTMTLAELVEKTESAFKKYYAENADADKKINGLKDMKAQAQQIVDTANDFLDRIKPTLETTVHSVLSLDADMKDCKRVLKDEIDKEIEAIKALKPALGADFLDIVEACTMIVFCPNPAMIAVQVMGLGYKAFKGDEIENDLGEKVNEKLLIHSVSNIQSSAQSLVNGYKTKKGEDQVTVDDPSASKLVTQKEDFLKLISDFKKILGEDKLKPVVKAFDDFINTTLERNEHIMLYNANIDLFYKKQADIKAATSQLASLTDQVLSTIDPDLPGAAIFMERTYYDSMWILLETLYMSQRALGFWTGMNKNHIAKALKAKPQGFLDAATLGYVRTRLLQAYKNEVENKSHSPQIFPKIKVPVPDRQLSFWKRSKDMKVMIKIPPAMKLTSLEDNPFAGKCDVRLKTVRFFAKGVTGKTTTLKVVLTHLGVETIVDSNDVAHPFTHEKVKLDFEYNTADMTYDFASTDGNIGKQSTSDVYALVGPFASWLVEIVPQYNPGVSLQGVTSAWFEFNGEYYTF